MLHIWLGSGAVENYLLYVENCGSELQNLANWPAEFGKFFCGKLWSLGMTLSCTGSVGLSSCKTHKTSLFGYFFHMLLPLL